MMPPKSTMVGDRNILRAINNISIRSERQEDPQKLVDSYVDTGIIDLLLNNNNQIIFGRRGTGKTHLLKTLEGEFKKEGCLTLYVDCRTFGSAASITDSTLSPTRRCIHLFRDLLDLLHEAFLNEALASECSPESIKILDDLLDSFNEYEQEYVTYLGRTKAVVQSDNERKIKITGGTDESGLGFEHSKNEKTASECETELKYTQHEVLVFPNFNGKIKSFLEIIDKNVIILIDEWVSIPKLLQPIFSEFLKRSLLVCNRVTVKIATIEYHSRFLDDNSVGGRIGIEVGADISDAANLDDFYVYDLNHDFVINYFSNVLYRHLAVELPAQYLENEYGVRNADNLVSKLFTQKTVFDELARACEGVTRDFINILEKCIIRARQKSLPKVDKSTVMNVAGEWFEKDKHPSLNDKSEQLLSEIISDVIGKNKARCFMVEQKNSNHIALQALYDFRVIHLIHRGYSSKSNPGLRYNIFILDYGTYVEMLKTQQWNAQMSLFIDNNEPIDKVPFDDKRSIRRIILKEEILNKYL